MISADSCEVVLVRKFVQILERNPGLTIHRKLHCDFPTHQTHPERDGPLITDVSALRDEIWGVHQLARDTSARPKENRGNDIRHLSNYGSMSISTTLSYEIEQATNPDI
jgi:hypothetical protein